MMMMAGKIKMLAAIAVILAVTGMVGMTVSCVRTQYGIIQDPNSVPGLTFNEWVERTGRPGFILLDQADLADYYICLYDTGHSEIALCYKWKHPREEPDIKRLIIYDAENRNLQDEERWNHATPLNDSGSVPAAAYISGLVIPVRPEYRGKIRVDFKDSQGFESAQRSVYTKALDYKSP